MTEQETVVEEKKEVVSEALKLKVKTKPLITFLEKVSMSGKQAIAEGVLRFEETGLKICANSQVKQARVQGWLKKDAFEEYSQLGNIGLNQFPDFIRVLKRFDSVVTFKKEGNLLTISGAGKSVGVELIDENFLSTDITEPALEFKETFTIKNGKLKDIFEDVKMNKDAKLTIETAEKKINFSNTGKWKFNNTVDCETVKGEEDVKVSFGQPFLDALSALTEDLEISLSSDYPCKVIEKTETSIITLIVAPRVEDE